jgi:hypothetical protein
MSIRSGDRARASKVQTKRRLRRSRLRLLRRVSEPSLGEGAKPGLPAKPQ